MTRNSAPLLGRSHSAVLSGQDIKTRSLMTTLRIKPAIKALEKIISHYKQYGDAMRLDVADDIISEEEFYAFQEIVDLAKSALRETE